MKARKLITYSVFILWVCTTLVLVRPKPDVISINFSALSSGYANLLIGLGGFAITVLAVLLGLEALDAGRPGEDRTQAHQAAVRHVAISLAVASITCFVGANMLTEVNALGSAVEQDRTAMRVDFTNRLKAANLTPAQIAEAEVNLGPSSFQRPARSIMENLPQASDPGWEAQQQKMDEVLQSSVRRHFVLASVTAYLASFLLVQALSFLLLIRFPNHPRIDMLQNIGVLGIGGTLFIKMVHTASYGMSPSDFVASRAVIAAILIVGCLLYARHTRQSLLRPELRSFTPLLPYFVSLAICLLSMLTLAATFSNYGPPTTFDRLLVILGPTAATALLLVIQIERPTIEILNAPLGTMRAPSELDPP